MPSLYLCFPTRNTTHVSRGAQRLDVYERDKDNMLLIDASLNHCAKCDIYCIMYFRAGIGRK